MNRRSFNSRRIYCSSDRIYYVNHHNDRGCRAFLQKVSENVFSWFEIFLVLGKELVDTETIREILKAMTFHTRMTVTRPRS